MSFYGENCGHERANQVADVLQHFATTIVVLKNPPNYRFCVCEMMNKRDGEQKKSEKYKTTQKKGVFVFFCCVCCRGQVVEIRFYTTSSPRWASVCRSRITMIWAMGPACSNRGRSCSSSISFGTCSPEVPQET